MELNFTVCRKARAYLAAARWRRVKDLRLHVRGQVGVDGQNDELADLFAQAAQSLRDHLGGALDLLLAREEDKNVALRLRDVNLEDGDYDGLYVVGLGLFCVVDVDWVAATWVAEQKYIVVVRLIVILMKIKGKSS